MHGARRGGSVSGQAARRARAAPLAGRIQNICAAQEPVTLPEGPMKKMSISRRTYLKTFAGLSAGAMAQFSGLFRSVWEASAAVPPPLRLIVVTQPHANTKYWAPRMPGGALAQHGQTGWTLDFDAGVTDLKPDRKSTRLNSSHTVISYAVFCL